MTPERMKELRGTIQYDTDLNLTGNRSELLDLLTMASASERYRKALEKIVGHGGECDRCDSIEIASEALVGGETHRG
jgi:hypothetical protein